MSITSESDQIKLFENHIRILCAELESTQCRLEYEREKNYHINLYCKHKKSALHKDRELTKKLIEREENVHIEDRTCILS